MRVCIPTKSPGGKDSEVAESFEESDLLDIYDFTDHDLAVLTVQIRNCGGMCRDDTETIVRRKVDAVVVRSIRDDVRHRLNRAGIKVFLAANGPARQSLDTLVTRGLLDYPPKRK